MRPFLLLHLPIFLYLLGRLVLPLKASRTAKILIALLLLLVSQHYALRMLTGYMSTPELPGALIILEGWAYAAVLFLFLLLAVSDCAALLDRAAARLRKKPRTRLPLSPGRRKALLAVAASLPAAYGVGKAVARPVTRSSEVFPARLHPDLDGLSLVQLTDLHASPLFDRAWMGDLARQVNDLHPDLIVLTGDIADGKAGRRLSELEPLGDLRARYGIYGCFGNHEYYSGFEEMRRMLSSLGVTMLENSHALVEARGRKLVVAGVTDEVAGRFSLPLPDWRAALDGAPEDALRIMLEHRPGNAAQSAAAGADVQLSGHTHGGHILGLDRLVARFNNGYVRGWYQVGEMALYVSPGAGLWNGFPLRMGVPGEVSRIVLRKR